MYKTNQLPSDKPNRKVEDGAYTAILFTGAELQKGLNTCLFQMNTVH